MECPYLRRGERQSYCRAYPGKLMVPSQYESEYFCKAPSHRSCVWHESALREASTPGSRAIPQADVWVMMSLEEAVEIGAGA